MKNAIYRHFLSDFLNEDSFGAQRNLGVIPGINTFRTEVVHDDRFERNLPGGYAGYAHGLRPAQPPLHLSTPMGTIVDQVHGVLY